MAIVYSGSCRSLTQYTGTTKVIGGSNYLDTDYNSAPNWLNGYFVLSGSAACELQYQVQTTMATQGLGIETNFSTTEQYTSVAIWKVA